MKQKWLVVLASLALNLAVVGSFLFLRVRGRRGHHRRPVPGLGREQLQGLRRMRKEFSPQMDSLRDRAVEVRTALMRLAGQESPDPRLIDSLLGEIGRTDAGMNRLAFEHARRITAQLPPEAREEFLRRLSENHGRGGHRRGWGPRTGPPPDEDIPPDDINP